MLVTFRVRITKLRSDSDRSGWDKNFRIGYGFAFQKTFSDRIDFCDPMPFTKWYVAGADQWQSGGCLYQGNSIYLSSFYRQLCITREVHSLHRFLLRNNETSILSKSVRYDKANRPHIKFVVPRSVCVACFQPRSSSLLLCSSGAYSFWKGHHCEVVFAL